MKINDFSGGINKRVHPSLLAEKEGVQFRNVDNSSKILKSFSDPVQVEGADSIFGYFYKFEDTWLSSASQRSYAEYQNVVYWTEEGQKPQKFDGGRTSQLGIKKPNNSLTLTIVDELDAPTVAPTASEVAPVGTGIKDEAIDITYYYTFYDTELNRESLPSDPVTITVSANMDVEIDVSFSSNTDIDLIKLYRNSADLDDFTFVQEIINSTTTLTDSATADDIKYNPQITDAGISGDEEVLQYVYTYYNRQDNIESAPSELSEELTLPANKAVTVSDIEPSEDIQVDVVRIYRTGDGATEFTLIHELEITELSVFDNVKTINAIGSLLDSVTNFPPPSDGRFATEAYGILFMAVGASLYFSEIGKPDYFPPTNEIKFSKNITGIFPVPNGILVFSRTTTEIVLGNTAGNFSKLPVSDEQGCISHYSNRLVRNTPTWVGLEGLCTYSNGIVNVISKPKLGKVQLDVVNSAVYDETYWLCLADGSILLMDTRFGDLTFKDIEYSKPMDNILSNEGILYGRQGDKLVNLLDEGTPIPMEYISPELTEGEFTNNKNYNNIYIRASSKKGNRLEVFVIINRKLVHNKVLDGDDVFDVTPPEEKQKGTSIQFHIIGHGEVYEINYKVLGRQNGR